MNELPSDCKILKSLVVLAKYSNGSTLFLTCQTDDGKGCNIYEQLPDGKRQRWPEEVVGGAQQAECLVYQLVR